MLTKQRLALAWKGLNDLAKNYELHTPSSLELAIVEIEQDLAEARRLIHIGGFTPVYAVGIEHQPGEYGMTNGPTPDLKEMLSVVPFGGDAHLYRLFRFSNGLNILTHRWSTEDSRWVPVSQ